MEEEAKAEAKELIERFKVIELSPKDDICITFKTQEIGVAKQCALICVDEMLKVIPMYTGTLNPKWELYTEVRAILEQY